MNITTRFRFWVAGRFCKAAYYIGGKYWYETLLPFMGPPK